MNIEIVNVEYPGTLSKGTEQEVRFTIKNNGNEFYQELHFFASVNDNKVYCENRAPIAIKAGETAVSSFYFTPDSVAKYNLWLCKSSSGSGEVYHTTVDIVDPASAKKASLYFNSIKINNASNGNVFGNVMDGTIIIKNQKTTPFNGRVKIQLWRQKEVGSSTYQSNQNCIKEIEIPASRTLSVPFKFENLTIGRNYEVVVYYVGQDGAIENGDLWKGHRFLINSGILYWRNNGAISGVSDKDAFTTPNTAIGLLIENCSIKTIKKNTNPNTIYAINTSGNVPTGVEDYNFVVNGHADTLSFVDSYAYYVPVEFEAKHATFTYNVPALADSVKWDAITLPFAATSAMIDGKVYPLDSPYNPFFIYDFTQLANDNTPIFEQVYELRGETPYLIAADSSIAGKSIVFMGDNLLFHKSGSVNLITSSNAYAFNGVTYVTNVNDVYVLNEKGSAFELTDKASVKAIDTYFTTSLPAEMYLQTIILPEVPEYVPNPNPDAIEILQAGNVATDSYIYTLTGQKIGKVKVQNGVPFTNGLRPGVYVIAGKKVMIK